MDGRQDTAKPAETQSARGKTAEARQQETIRPNKRNKNITFDTQTTEKPLQSREEAVSRDSLLKLGLSAKLPEVIVHSLAPFFDEGGLYRAYGVILRAKASVSREIEIEAHESELRDAVLSVMQAHRRGKVRDVFAVLYSKPINI